MTRFLKFLPVLFIGVFLFAPKAHAITVRLIASDFTEENSIASSSMDDIYFTTKPAVTRYVAFDTFARANASPLATKWAQGIPMVGIVCDNWTHKYMFFKPDGTQGRYKTGETWYYPDGNGNLYWFTVGANDAGSCQDYAVKNFLNGGVDQFFVEEAGVWTAVEFDDNITSVHDFKTNNPTLESALADPAFVSSFAVEVVATGTNVTYMPGLNNFISQYNQPVYWILGSVLFLAFMYAVYTIAKSLWKYFKKGTYDI